MYANKSSLDFIVGDYIETTVAENTDISQQKVRWLIADIDNYMYTGNTEDGKGLTQHHVTIIPAKPLGDYKPMNEKQSGADTTKCGYAGSDMVGILDKNDDTCKKLKEEKMDPLGSSTSTLHYIYDTYIKPDFKDTSGNEHVLPYQTVLTNKTDDQATNNRMGNNGIKGASSNATWYTRKLDLMSEMNVYGGIVASSSVWDTGIDNRQYAIFRLKPEFMNSYDGNVYHYWLKDIASSTQFAFVDDNGNQYDKAWIASGHSGVRPRFLIGEFFNLDNKKTLLILNR